MAKKYPPPESRAASKHVLVYPNWMSAQRYHEYQESRARAARVEHDKLKQKADRHNAFVENAKKHGIPLSKRKSEKIVRQSFGGVSYRRSNGTRTTLCGAPLSN